MALEPIVIDGNVIQALPYPDKVSVVAYTAAAAASSAFQAGTNMVRLVASTACHVKIAADPTATTSDMYLAADVAEYFVVAEGQKVSAIQVSANGNLNVAEFSIGN